MTILQTEMQKGGQSKAMGRGGRGSGQKKGPGAGLEGLEV